MAGLLLGGFMTISGKEMLSLVDVISHERQVDKELIFEALENSLSTSLKKDYGKSPLRVEINRSNGTFSAFKVREVVADVDWMDESQVRLSEALKLDPKNHVGSIIETKLDVKDLSRVNAQVFKQLIRQNIKQAERKTSQEHYSKEIGNLFLVTIKKFIKNDVIVTLPDETDAVIPASETNGMRFKLGAKTYAVLEKIESYKGNQLIFSKNSEQYIRAILKKEIPAISEENVAIIAVGRVHNKKTKVVVKPLVAHVDAIRECVGPKGTRVKQVIEHLNGEHVEFALYDKELGNYIFNLLAPINVEKVVIDEKDKVTTVIISDEDYNRSKKHLAATTEVIEQILNTDVYIMTEEQFSSQRSEDDDKIIKIFIEHLNVDQDLAEVLIDEGFLDIETIAYSHEKELLSVEGFDEDLIKKLQEAARNALLLMKDNDLMNLKSMNSVVFCDLVEKGITSTEALSDLATDELLDLIEIDEEDAKKMIMEARAITLF